ncbi:MAG TPA: HAMP domain-containing sensor histidine kinase [Acidimicrobiales bacterium]|nr:HAMP domain-containing sensor histidine kinase [Acidimicrobiales bacterium]
MVAIAGSALVAATGIVGSARSAAKEEAQAQVEREGARLQAALGAVDALVSHGDPSACVRSGFLAPVVLDLGPEAPVPLACVVRRAGGELVGPRSLPELEAVLTEDSTAGALARARDQIETVLSPPTAGRSLLAAPLYRRVGGIVHRPSEPSLETAREELAGHLVALVDARALLGETGQGWQVTDGGTVLAGPDAFEGSTASADVVALDRRWVLTRPVDLPSWARVDVLAVAALALLGVVLLGAADRRRRGDIEQHEDDARRAEARAAVVASLAGIVQQSADLDEILPALAVRLSDELGLAGLSLSAATPAGEQRQLFVHGTPPDLDVSPAVLREGVVGRGETFALDLHRADRSIAVLRVVAGVPLEATALGVLRLAGEMVTSTIVASRSIEQQQEAVRRLESLDELKTTFLGVASHELRTPATAISGLATLLAQRWEDLGDGERQTFAERIATNANALNTLVQDLLDFARLERGDLRLVQEPVDLSATVVGLLERLSSVWSEHRVEPRIDDDVAVLGDPSALERVVTNLVSNAIKFSPPGETVTVTVREAGGSALLVVDDAGPGVPEHERDKIFVRFFRGTDDAVVRTRGVGIGLSVVQDFVAQMGGAVRVEDSPAGGARFVVELPVLDRARQEVRDVAPT